jgi:hypothetical protein
MKRKASPSATAPREAPHVPSLMPWALLPLATLMVSCSLLYRLVSPPDPLQGRWREVAWIQCGSGQEVVPEDPIRELMFRSDGTVTVAWHPIETYVDYRGAYELIEERGLKIVITWSAYAPRDFEGEGTYRIDDAGDLHLVDIWLGSPRDTRGLEGCGHRFERAE